MMQHCNFLLTTLTLTFSRSLSGPLVFVHLPTSLIHHMSSMSLMQRLSQENSQQQDIIQQLVLRLDRLETVMQYMEASAEPEKVKPPKLAWGGFFGPRGLV